MSAFQNTLRRAAWTFVQILLANEITFDLDNRRALQAAAIAAILSTLKTMATEALDAKKGTG